MMTLGLHAPLPPSLLGMSREPAVCPENLLVVTEEESPFSHREQEPAYESEM